MCTMSSTQRNYCRTSPALVAVFIVLATCINLARLAGVGFTCYVVYDSLIVKGEVRSSVFDVPDQNTDLGENISKRSIDEENSFESSADWINITLIIIPIVEVVVASSIVILIIGPLSPQVKISTWMRLIIRMRVFWMRLIWIGTAVAYSLIVLANRTKKFNETYNPKYLNTQVFVAKLITTCTEYALLSMLQCTMKIMTFETVGEKITKAEQQISSFWKKTISLTFYITILAFALRNFSMSLYFGILCTVVSQDDAEQENGGGLKLGAIIVVLQVYLAIIRGWFYGYFMKAFLSLFLVEEDDEIFLKIQNKNEDVNQSEEDHSLINIISKAKQEEDLTV
ncbi:uncharacterized protein LOC143452034 isoform X1 [Clavelina lepadiformis]|uniref:uncharacterized protein LOC143452034 isoform X1 n=1 Tax=Clavelina lepadiformis TaxID=159417 RepID=UPI004042623C